MIESALVSKIEANLFKKRKIFISDEIGNYDSTSFCSAIEYLVSQSKERIYVYITSQGGAVFPMLGMYDALKLAQKAGIEVVTIAVGLSASAAAVLLQAGNERWITKHSRILIHEVSQANYGLERVSDAEENAKEMTKINNLLLQIISDRCGKSVEELKTLTHKKDVWFDAEEALQFGLVDKIIQ